MLKRIIPVALPLALTACQTAQTDALPDVSALVEAAGPDHSSRKLALDPVITDYTHREPADPKSWRELNEDQAPKKGTGS